WSPRPAAPLPPVVSCFLPVGVLDLRGEHRRGALRLSAWPGTPDRNQALTAAVEALRSAGWSQRGSPETPLKSSAGESIVQTVAVVSWAVRRRGARRCRSRS